MHVVAPAPAPSFVIDPAMHALQSLASFEPPVSTYLPASQSMHAVEMLDAVEYLPAAQTVHVVAPVLVPLSVIDPAAHVMHDSTFDAVEYSPAAHAMHELAPAAVPLLVIEPATHTLQ